jgi:hypothetical protein
MNQNENKSNPVKRIWFRIKNWWYGIKPSIQSPEMEIQDFIDSVVSQVRNSCNKLGNKPDDSCLINPLVFKKDEKSNIEILKVPFPIQIDFDIGVETKTVDSGTVSLVVREIGNSIESKNNKIQSQTSFNKIKFSIPVMVSNGKINVSDEGDSVYLGWSK